MAYMIASSKGLLKFPPLEIKNNKVITIKKYRIMNIKPLADRVLVLPAPAEEKVGGIIIPDTRKGETTAR